ncbi:MAG: hypothetical protein PVJ57_03660 [Phycisphaerae bacterium]|jgi:hypothetical protein
MPNARRSALEQLSAEQREFLNDADGRRAPSVTLTAGTQIRSAEAAPCHIGAAPTVANVHGQSLRSVTLRLTPATADALRRAAAQRGLRYEHPFTQQSIAEAAIRAWLARQGYPPQ